MAYEDVAGYQRENESKERKIAMPKLTEYESKKLKDRFLEKLGQELTDIDFIIDIVSGMQLDDVFSISALEEWAKDWAEENGYTKP